MATGRRSPRPGEVIGRNLLELRSERQWTQEEAVRWIRRAGLPWTRSNLAAIETGRRDDVTTTELHFLASTFDVAPERLFAGEGAVQLSPRLVKPLAAVREVLTGRTAGRGRKRRADVVGAVGTAALEAALQMSASNPEPYEGYRLIPSAAESHAGKRMGIDGVRVHELAYQLWGHGLDEERDLRMEDRPAMAGSQTVYRGHVTRTLLAELRDKLEADEEGSP